MLRVVANPSASASLQQTVLKISSASIMTALIPWSAEPIEIVLLGKTVLMDFVVHLKNVMRLTLVRQVTSVSRVAVNLSANVGPIPIALFCSVVLKVFVRKRVAAIMTAIAAPVKFVMP